MTRRFGLYLLLLAAFLSAANTAWADSLGDARTFKVNQNYDAQSASTVGATLRALGDKVYFYVDDRHWAGLSSSARAEYLSDLQDLVFAWDSAIYPRSTAFWGTENTPGVDGDPRVVILLENLVSGNGGYFETIHGYSTEQSPNSNGREMFVVSANSVGTSTRILAFISHEFQHLISFNQRELRMQAADDVWLNEVRSEHNVTVAGYNDSFSGSSLQSRMFAFERSPSDSLTEWPNTSTDYAIAAIFGHYLSDRYGPQLLQHTIHTRLPGVQAINEWFEDTGRTERFADVFADWMAAVIINDSTDIRYSYESTGLTNLHLNPTHQGDADDSWSLELIEFQPAWIQVNLPTSGVVQSTLTMFVDGEAGAAWNGTAIAEYDGGVRRIMPWRAANGITPVSIPTTSEGRRLRALTLGITHGSDASTEGRIMGDRSVSVRAVLGDLPASTPPSGPVPSSAPAPSGSVRDGDLIRKGIEKEVYVVWGNYKRFMVPGTLELYGFQNRPVVSVDADTFNRYTTSNYVRQVDTEPVYAVWPDGTKHHLAITAAAWDASGRDWNSIFIINALEAAFYPTGEPITR